MPSKFSCWVIVVGAQPTAFRARHAEDLLPTLKQLQRTQPNVELKWFERGRFWTSPEAAAEEAWRKQRQAAGRNRDWRPGGSHVDPRKKYEISRDEKRARFKRRVIAGHRPPTSGDHPGPRDARPFGEGKPRTERRPFKPFRDDRGPRDDNRGRGPAGTPGQNGRSDRRPDGFSGRSGHGPRSQDRPKEFGNQRGPGGSGSRPGPRGPFKSYARKGPRRPK